MSATLTTTTEQIHVHQAKPNFFGLVRGEFLKVTHQWATWIIAALLVCFIAGPYLITLTVSSITTDINTVPLQFLYRELGYGSAILRVFAGLFLIVLAARSVGLEYQLGTIRVLLSRGVGRLQLFFAKLLTIILIGIIVLIVGILLNVLLLGALLLIKTGNLNAFNAITNTFWSDTWLAIASIMVSMGVSLLMAITMAILGRSQVFGLSAALAFFPIDNFGQLFLILGNRLTQSDAWLQVSAYLLGPNLNTMPASLSKNIGTIGLAPLVAVDGTHTMLVALVYAVIFLAVSIVLTWKRDVKE